MSRQRIVIGCMVGLLAGLLSPLPSLAMPPTVSEVLAVHQANRDKLTPLHVEWTSTQEWTDAFRTVYQQKADFVTAHEATLVDAVLKHYETQLKQHADGTDAAQADTPEITRDRVRRMIRGEAYTAKALATNTRLRRHCEIFLRGDHRQIRTPRSKASGEVARWTFPTTPLTAESLSTTYKGDLTIDSRTGGPSPTTRIWSGPSSPVGVTSKPYGGPLPPFSAAANAYERQRHPIDVFFDQPAERYRIAGTEEHAGRTLTVVDVVVDTERMGTVSDEHGTHPLSPHMIVYRGWLDLARGAVPVKLHTWERPKETKLDTIVGQQPDKILVVSSIRDMENGAFFPILTVEEEFGSTPEAANMDTTKRQAPEDGKPSVKVVHNRVTWMCHIVDREVPAGEEFFALPLPAGHPVRNLDTPARDAEEEEPIVRRTGRPAPPLKVARWLDGQERTLADLRGQVIVIDFWTPDESTRRDYLPVFRQLQQQYKSQPVTFLVIHPATPQPEEVAGQLRSLAKELPGPCLFAIDAGTTPNESATAKAYGGTPPLTTVILDPAGRICFHTCEGPPELWDALDFGDEAASLVYQKQLFEGAGIAWPLPENLSEAETRAVMQKVHVFMFSQRIDAALAPK